jgi:membrane protein
MPVRAAFRIFMNAQVTDLAAALAYYAVLCIFPTIALLVSLLGLIGSSGTAQTLLDGVGAIGPESAVKTLRGPIENLVNSNGAAGITALIAFLLALWAASGYVGGFIRGANRILGVEETRSTVALRAVQVRLTLIAIGMIAGILAALALSGPLLDGAASSLGVGETAKTVFAIARWPLIALTAAAAIAILSREGPNVDNPPLPWRSVLPGTALSLLIWLAGSSLFALYVATLGSYGSTYAGLAGPVVLLVWLWLSNVALLVGVAMQAAIAEAADADVSPP